MTRLNPALTSLKTLNITYRTPQETLLGTPATLPTSEPIMPQISYTVASNDLPTFNISPYQKKWVAIVVGAGKAVTAAIIYLRMKKNGASVSTSSNSVSANYFYTYECFFYDVNVGDVLELALWSNQADSKWDYKAYQILFSRLILLNKPRLLSPCNFAAFTTQPALTLGNPYSNYYYFLPYHCDQVLPSITSYTSYDFLYPKDTYGMFRLGYGDYLFANVSLFLTSATYRPNYYRNYVPTQIIMRGIKTD
jgi:hypothetical protein